MPNYDDHNLIIDLINSTVPPSEREYYFKALDDLVEQIFNEKAANSTNTSAIYNNTDVYDIRNKTNERCN